VQPDMTSEMGWGLRHRGDDGCVGASSSTTKKTVPQLVEGGDTRGIGLTNQRSKISRALERRFSALKHWRVDPIPLVIRRPPPIS
jgi:hypothetical protein